MASAQEAYLARAVPRSTRHTQVQSLLSCQRLTADAKTAERNRLNRARLLVQMPIEWLKDSLGTAAVNVVLREQDLSAREPDHGSL